MTATLIDGKAIAARMRGETLREARALTESGWAPKLVSISVGDVAAAELYVRNQQRQANDAGDLDRGTLGDGGCAYHAHAAHFGMASAGYEFPMIRGRAPIPDPLAADISRSPFEIYRPPIL